MPKLNQVIAVEKTTKTRVQSAVDKLYHALDKSSLFEGFLKTYQSSREDEPAQPAQAQRVQFKVSDVVNEVRSQLDSLFAIVAQKDFANTAASADIVVDDVTLATGVPTTYLLFLEKQLTDLHTLVSKLPVLDPSADWKFDSVKGYWKTDATETQRTRKVAKPIVLYPATTEHPAQTQLINEDIVVGSYSQTRLSGATTESDRAKLLARIDSVQKAVKFAREKANNTDAPKQEVGSKVLDFIFSA